MHGNEARKPCFIPPRLHSVSRAVHNTVSQGSGAHTPCFIPPHLFSVNRAMQHAVGQDTSEIPAAQNFGPTAVKAGIEVTQQLYTVDPVN